MQDFFALNDDKVKTKGGGDSMQKDFEKIVLALNDIYDMKQEWRMP